MNGYKKHLISQRIPANSFKSERIDSFNSEAPTLPVRETNLSGHRFKLKNFLGAGFKWPRNKKKSEPGAPTEEPGHRRKGSFFSEELKNPADEFQAEKRHNMQALNSLAVFRVLIFIQLLKNSFFRFMETVFLLDSPGDLALISETASYQPVAVENPGLSNAAGTPGFKIWRFINRKSPDTSQLVAEKVTSIAARYRNLESQPVKILIKNPAFGRAKMAARGENYLMVAGYA